MGRPQTPDPPAAAHLGYNLLPAGGGVIDKSGPSKKTLLFLQSDQIRPLSLYALVWPLPGLMDREATCIEATEWSIRRAGQWRLRNK